MTVTLPVHPFYGMTLAVVRHERDQRGRRYVTAEHPVAGHLRLPYEWTDRSAPRPAPTVNGQPVRIGVEGLLALARVVDVALRKKLDAAEPPPAPSFQAEQTHRPFDICASGVVSAVGDDPARPARGMGVPCAKDAAAPRVSHRRGAQ